MPNSRPQSDLAASRKAEMRQRLIDAAAAEIAEKGLNGLKARDLTRRAGCALGALYTAFTDLDDLVLHVNSRTLTQLGAALQQALPTGTTEAEAVTQALARAYVNFALSQPELWSTLFSHTPPAGRHIPDWHRQEYEMLMARIIAPLGKLRPDLPPARMLLRIRTLFGAVHGVVHLSLQDRPIGVPRDMLHEEVAALITAMAQGAREVAQR